ncbi:magnesium-protoporphyrin IX monomethyl ester [oxidative] cyclase, chloroplastic-like [Brachypodium distachyon]|uniref:magnesium-protoporphyrin IX monomethyl ester [oxidative] cyclase, chloroplastic-like n=1 Tax=Brachypodium distachyon TaxID=15368 RepID=UPI000D0CE60E|nr:magnesium-protoporphyrin IX monomethyl ester [oxidative] cyclase, chloroplastic-like [Brachypodium distachyon]|eukprot:XP_024310339.1 magnesium-protoporphyrin IX monomethyl ester [oxidative] cyclase, chloroplastic-like [Brachypodium distachyon]
MLPSALPPAQVVRKGGAKSYKAKFIFYATYLSEKIGYWRYTTIFRHLKANPEYQVYPIFKYFGNWCPDKNRHRDFFALLKAQPQFLNDWKAKLWSCFFCLSILLVVNVGSSGDGDISHTYRLFASGLNGAVHMWGKRLSKTHSRELRALLDNRVS